MFEPGENGFAQISGRCAIAAQVAELGALSTQRPPRVATPGDLAADLGHTRLYPALLTGGTLSKDVTTQPARFA